MFKMVYSSNLIIPPDYWTYQVKNKIKSYVIFQYIDYHIT